MRHWYQEVHRRGLWQAAAGFLAAAWVVIEVVDLLTGRGLLPDWVFNGTLILLAIGFPVVLATAYVQTPPEAEAKPGASDQRQPASVPGLPTDPSASVLNSEIRRPGLAGILTWRNALMAAWERSLCLVWAPPLLPFFA